MPQSSTRYVGMDGHQESMAVASGYRLGTLVTVETGNIGDSLLHVLAHQEVRHALESDRPDD